MYVYLIDTTPIKVAMSVRLCILNNRETDAQIHKQFGDCSFN
jgi:hypothetical protein